jgi:hypothetical protein
VTLFGDVLVDILGRGTPEQVTARVYELLDACAPGDGYVLTSGNSQPEYIKLENAIAMGRARDAHYGLVGV